MIGWQDTGTNCQSAVKNKTWGQLKEPVPLSAARACRALPVAAHEGLGELHGLREAPGRTA